MLRATGRRRVGGGSINPRVLQTEDGFALDLQLLP